MKDDKPKLAIPENPAGNKPVTIRYIPETAKWQVGGKVYDNFFDASSAFRKGKNVQERAITRANRLLANRQTNRHQD